MDSGGLNCTDIDTVTWTQIRHNGSLPTLRVLEYSEYSLNDFLMKDFHFLASIAKIYSHEVSIFCENKFPQKIIFNHAFLKVLVETRIIKPNLLLARDKEKHSFIFINQNLKIQKVTFLSFNACHVARIW